jgi:hypothetical protein
MNNVAFARAEAEYDECLADAALGLDVSISRLRWSGRISSVFGDIIQGHHSQRSDRKWTWR